MRFTCFTVNLSVICMQFERTCKLFSPNIYNEIYYYAMQNCLSAFLTNTNTHTHTLPVLVIPGQYRKDKGMLIHSKWLRQGVTSLINSCILLFRLPDFFITILYLLSLTIWRAISSDTFLYMDLFYGSAPVLAFNHNQPPSHCVWLRLKKWSYVTKPNPELNQRCWQFSNSQLISI